MRLKMDISINLTCMRLYFVALFFIVSACHNDKCNGELLFGTNTDSFVSSFPKGSSSHEWLKYDKREIGALDTLENGYADFQLRIWIYDTLIPNIGDLDNRQIIVVKKNKTWSAQNILSTWKTAEDSAFMVEKKIINLKVSDNWDCFADSLHILGILSLEDESEDPGFILRTHTPRILVEISNKSMYKFITYTSPVKYGHEVKDAQKFVEIISFLERKLGFKRIAVY
jgi:hypothetical protein